MKARGILFKGNMVVPIKEERKTHTRRINGLDVVNYSDGKHKPTSHLWTYKGPLPKVPQKHLFQFADGISEQVVKCPYGIPGDRLWVKETWKAWEDPETGEDFILYRADNEKLSVEELGIDGTNEQECHSVFWEFKKWVSPIFMPRLASRFLLEITDIRVEHIQDISYVDCMYEGIEIIQADGAGSWRVAPGEAPAWYISEMKKLWDLINEERGYPWADNPWVWVIVFKLIKRGR